jgi:hypothetical protein
VLVVVVVVELVEEVEPPVLLVVVLDPHAAAAKTPSEMATSAMQRLEEVMSLAPMGSCPDPAGPSSSDGTTRTALVTFTSRSRRSGLVPRLLFLHEKIIERASLLAALGRGRTRGARATFLPGSVAPRASRPHGAHAHVANRARSEEPSAALPEEQHTFATSAWTCSSTRTTAAAAARCARPGACARTPRACERVSRPLPHDRSEAWR